MSIKVLIVDDEPLARSLLEEHLASMKEVQVLDSCSDGFEALKSLKIQRPDVILLDIHMPKLNGFELLEVMENPPAVIFITAYDQYAIKAFEAGAIDYLLKPVALERLEKAFAKLQQAGIEQKQEQQKALDQLNRQSGKHEEEGRRIVVKNGTSIRMISTHELVYIEAYDDYVRLHLPGEFLLKKQTMNYFEEVLDPRQFVRIHRSFMIKISSLNKLEAMEKDSYVAILKNGIRLPVSRSGYDKLKQVLNW